MLHFRERERKTRLTFAKHLFLFLKQQNRHMRDDEPDKIYLLKGGKWIIRLEEGGFQDKQHHIGCLNREISWERSSDVPCCLVINCDVLVGSSSRDDQGKDGVEIESWKLMMWRRSESCMWFMEWLDPRNKDGKPSISSRVIKDKTLNSCHIG